MDDHSVLVTGFSGFIGRRLMRWLKQEGVSVSGCDIEGVEHPLDLARPGQEKEVDALVKNAGVVVHLAGDGSTATCQEHPYLAMQRNVMAAVTVLAACERQQRPLILASSAQVYGRIQQSPVSISHPRVPLTTYGFSKLAMEHLAEHFATARDGIPSITVARFFNVYGPGQDSAVTYHTAVIPDRIRQVLDGKDLYFDTAPGAGSRDYIYIDDLCCLLGGLVDRAGKASGIKYFNLGSGAASTIGDVAQAIITAAAEAEARVVRAWYACTPSAAEQAMCADRVESFGTAAHPAVSLRQGVLSTYRAMLEARAPVLTSMAKTGAIPT